LTVFHQKNCFEPGFLNKLALRFRTFEICCNILFWCWLYDYISYVHLITMLFFK